MLQVVFQGPTFPADMYEKAIILTNLSKLGAHFFHIAL